MRKSKVGMSTVLVRAGVLRMRDKITVAKTQKGIEMDDAAMITRALVEIKTVEEKFSKIQENPALNGPENGLTEHELKILEQLISLCGEANLAASAISRRLGS